MEKSRSDKGETKRQVDQQKDKERRKKLRAEASLLSTLIDKVIEQSLMAIRTGPEYCAVAVEGHCTAEVYSMLIEETIQISLSKT